MSEDRLARAREILLAAAVLPPDARTVFIDRSCGSDPELRTFVESLLEHADDVPTILRTDGLASALSGEFGVAARADISRVMAGRIGPYHILEVLGEGGMGIVFRAVQHEPIRREVAVKLIRQGHHADRLAARLEAERQTLAMMEHPNIATVLDAGSDGHGRPYFVMELVRGVPLTQHCREQGATVRQRLGLLTTVCRAVQHAHQKGIIHRDLKPSNLLVAGGDGEAVVKVIDFGIAKVLADLDTNDAQLTREGHPIGTLGYMSPEQARGDPGAIDTRSDVYSLGAVMYELLTGVSPHAAGDLAWYDQVRVICEEPPRRFRDLPEPPRRVAAELETITRKALAKDPADRYQSLSALADDIDRHLDCQPIMARPPSAAYHLQKLVARNRVATALLAAIVAMVIGFGVWMAVLYGRAEQNLRRAVQAEGEAGQVAGFMTEIFEISDPGESRGNAVTAREILDRGSARIGAELAGEPVVRSRLQQTMGRVYRGLGLYDQAGELLVEALAADGTVDADLPARRAAILNDLGHTYQLDGRYEDAAAAFDEAMAIQEERFGPDSPELASTLANAAILEFKLGRPEVAARHLERSVAIQEGAGTENVGDLANTVNNLAQVMQYQGRHAAAESLFVRSLRIREDAYEADHPELALGLNNLASFYWARGRLATAESLAVRAVAIREKVYGADHPELANGLVNLAALYEEMNEVQRAVPLLTRALAIQEKTLGPDHMEVAICLNNLGRAYGKLGYFTRAEQVLERSLDIRRRILGDGHPRLTNAQISLAEVSLAGGDLDRAEKLLQQALAVREAAYGADDERTALPVHDLGVLRLRQERYAEAEALLTRALEVRTAKMGPAHRRIVESLQACADLYRRTGREDLADVLTARAAEVRALL